ncbi:hemolymph lipopolysaccharide-binding protein [Orussus abietinus]|uniref:hemolymph lipopolysaccharide-binding protein n=1 Tax=Orussus abietinus TaxID=222816 RepID=UPI000626C68E|nr:hemolymph lipopolysaccharide-binding protein [Orussus abietinus]
MFLSAWILAMGLHCIIGTPLSSTDFSLPNDAQSECNCPEMKVNNWNNVPNPFSSLLNTVIIRGMTCFCNAGISPGPIRDDYQLSPGIGAHKLHTRPLAWNEARKMCDEEGGHLAVINSIAEAAVLREMLKKAGPIKGAAYGEVAYLGMHDLYKEGEWVTILGDSLPKAGYTKWSNKWNGQPDNSGGKQHCGVMLIDGDLDDVVCTVSFAYFCELPIS